MKKLSTFKFHAIINHDVFFVLTLCVFMIMLPGTVNSQQKDVPYVPTPNDVVEKMLEVANVGPGDYVIDLGSGDGRIVIAAAKRGAFAHGVDIDPQRITEARANAKTAGVTDKVVFVQGNIFETDFSQASVLTMYLLNSVNLKLRPKILETLRPGTRIVSHSFNMNDWKADDQASVNHSNIYYWVIPSDISGKWSWQTEGKKFTMNVDQEFQVVDLDLKSGNNSLNVQDPVLKGDRISFAAENTSSGEKYVFSGRIEDDEITGLVQIHNGNETSVEGWTATNGQVNGR